MKKAKYNIKEKENGNVLFEMSGVSVTFSSRKGLNKFAMELWESIKDRRVGKFKLQDEDNGNLKIIISKANGVIVAKDYDQAEAFAEQLYNDTL